MDRIEFTRLFTQLTADTANAADVHDALAAFFRSTLYMILVVIRNQLDQMLRTGLGTFSTGSAGIRIHYGNSVDNMNTIKLTGFYAVSETDTAKGTGLRSPILHVAGHQAAFDTRISIRILRLLAASCALYICHHTFAVANLGSHDGRNLRRNSLSADRTLVYRCLAGHNRSGQGRTPGKTTATAVISRKCFLYFILSRIRFHSEFLSGNAQEETDENTRTAYNCRGDQNSGYTHDRIPPYIIPENHCLPFFHGYRP